MASLHEIYKQTFSERHEASTGAHNPATPVKEPFTRRCLSQSSPGRGQADHQGNGGKTFPIRVRDNGHDYEVYLNGEKVGEGSFARPKGETSFRWGMSLGKNAVKHDAMIFVSGARVDGR